jgi:hypothetical protein
MVMAMYTAAIGLAIGTIDPLCAIGPRRFAVATTAETKKPGRLVTCPGLRMVPMSGIELLTYALRVRCSTN